ncbi:MAG: glycosyltransferase [Proteobacteria bacterium]|nr:glycosyltransferase [Pseudomonadota bacterium]
MDINIVYAHLRADDTQSLRRGSVTVIWSAKPIIGCDIYVYWDAFSYTGIIPGFSVLLLGEPIIVLPGQFHEAVWKEFDHIVTYYEALASEEKNISYILTPRLGWAHYPAAIENKDEREVVYPLRDRQQAICMIAGYKQSAVEGELYSKRLEIARWFGEHSQLAFDVYGYPPFPLPNYRGALMDGSSFTKESKYRTLAKYKFAVAFENINHPEYSRGYVSEKMLDCFETRTVPIYLGCTNIEDYIPSSCFIDMRSFSTYQDLSNYLMLMSESEYLQYIANIDTWVEAGNLSKYSCQGLYDHIVEIFARRTHCPVPSDYIKAKEWISLPVAEAREKLGMETQALSRWTWADMATKCVEATPLLSIMIISYNGIDHIKACVESIKRNTPESHEIVVVDNAKNDGSLDYVKTVPGTVVIANPTNIGYSPARAQAMSLVRGKYIASLDDDAIVTKGWASKFIKHAENHPEVGIIGPRSNYVSGPQIVNNASYHNIVELETFAEAWSSQNHDHVTQTIRLIGFCMFISRKVIDKIGCIDPNFGKLFGFDDDDYSLRTQVAGFKLLIADDIFIHHTGGPQGRGDNQYNELMLGAWEMFKEKWGIKKDLPYGSPYDIAEILSRKFDKSKHYSPLYERSILEKYVPRSILSHDDNRELSLAKLAAVPLTASEITVLGAIEPIGGWFTTAEVLSLHRLIKLLPNSAKILEIGSYRGRSTNAIGYAMRDTGMELYCLDVWRDFMEQGIRQLDATADLLPHSDFAIFEDFLRNVEQFGDKIRILRGSTAQFAGILPELFFDLIFVDGAHDYENVRRDITAALKCIKPGGIICGHDYHTGGVDVIRAVHELIFSGTPPVEHGVIGGTSIWFARYERREPVRPAQVVTNKIDNDCRDANVATKKGQLATNHEQIKTKKIKTTMVPGLTSIIIPVSEFNDNTRRCLESIRAHVTEPHEIILATIGSLKTPAWLNKFIAINTHCKIIGTAKNANYAASCNMALEKATGQYVLILDGNTVMLKGSLKKMRECMDARPEYGITVPMSNRAIGIQQIPKTQQMSFKDFEEYARAFGDRNRHRYIVTSEIDCIYALTKRELIDTIGLFNEQIEAPYFVINDFRMRALVEGQQAVIAGNSCMYLGRGDIRRKGSNEVFHEQWDIFNPHSATGKKLSPFVAMKNARDFNSKGLLDESVQAIMEGIKYAPEEEELYYCLAEILLEEKQYEESIEAIRSLPEAGRSKARALEILGYCSYYTGRMEEAENYADRVLSFSNDSARALNLKGLMALKREDRKKAEVLFRQAIAADPCFAGSYVNMGTIKWHNNEHREALDLIEKGFILSPETGDFSTTYNSAIASLNEFSRAERVFMEACGLFPENKRLSFLFIGILLQQEKYTEAMEEIENALVTFGIDDEILSAALSVRENIGSLIINASSRKTGTLSVCMIARNEEKYIARCLVSLIPVADEIIVVDTGSTDRTKDIARVFGAKVYDLPWTDDFSTSRNHSLSFAKGQWILVHDADEVISSRDYDKLKDIIGQKTPQLVAYTLTTRNYTNNSSVEGWNQNSGEYPDEEEAAGWHPSIKTRLFRNDSRIRFQNQVHEFVEPSLAQAGIEIRHCTIPIHHYGKLDQERSSSRAEMYFELGRKKMMSFQDTKALRELAIQAGELGKYTAAIGLWEMYIKFKPDDHTAYFNMTTLYLETGEFEKALAAARIARDINPQSKEALLGFATSSICWGDIMEATDVLENLHKKEPGYLTAIGALAAAYCIGEKTGKGIALLKEMQAKRYDCSIALHSLSKKLIKAERSEYAKLLLKSVVASGYNTLKDSVVLLEELNAQTENVI